MRLDHGRNWFRATDEEFSVRHEFWGEMMEPVTGTLHQVVALSCFALGGAFSLFLYFNSFSSLLQNRFSECLSVCFSQHGALNPFSLLLEQLWPVFSLWFTAAFFKLCAKAPWVVVATSLQSLPQGAHGWMSEMDR